MPSRSPGRLFLWEATIPRDPASNYTLPPTYLATAGQTIRTEQHNPPLEDIAQALTGSLARDGRGGMTGPLNMNSFGIKNLAPGVGPNDAATLAQAGVPIGTVVDWAGDTAPAGWFLCHGQALSRTDYAVLFAILGTKFGAGDGVTTFNLPDLRGRVTAGADNMGGTDASRLSVTFGALARTIGAAFGSAFHLLSLTEMPNHDHGGTTGATGGHSHSTTEVVAGGPGAIIGQGSNYRVAASATSAVFDHAHTISAEGGSQAHNNVQPVMVMNKIIKTSI